MFKFMLGLSGWVPPVILSFLIIVSFLLLFMSISQQLGPDVPMKKLQLITTVVLVKSNWWTFINAAF